MFLCKHLVIKSYTKGECTPCLFFDLITKQMKDLILKNNLFWVLNNEINRIFIKFDFLKYKLLYHLP